MGIVCKTFECAKALRDLRDEFIVRNSIDTPESQKIKVVGVVTLEDLIERTLQIDINDERDIDLVRKTCPSK